MEKPIIGLLGAPGSGKSLVASQLEQLGCGVIEADALAKQVLDEPAIREQLVAWWGDTVLDEAGRVNRRAVSQIVFNQPEALRRLESLVHPHVDQRRRALQARLRADPEVVAVVEDSPLLLEKNMQGGCDVLVFVDASWERRLERIRQTRGWSAEELERREKNQWPLDIKLSYADYVVHNDADESETFKQVQRVLSQILQR